MINHQGTVKGLGLYSPQPYGGTLGTLPHPYEGGRYPLTGKTQHPLNPQEWSICKIQTHTVTTKLRYLVFLRVDSENSWMSDGLPSSSRRRRSDGRGEGGEWREK